MKQNASSNDVYWMQLTDNFIQSDVQQTEENMQWTGGWSATW